MIRTFLAVELSEAVRNAITSLQDALKRRLQKDLSREARVVWVRPDSIHLTIKFLGDTDEGLVAPLQEALTLALATQQSAALPIERLGVFPRLQGPRVVWVGPPEEWERGEEAQRLAAIQQSVEQGCAELGFAREPKAFHPHLTLARVKEGERQFGQALARSGVMDCPVALGSAAIESIVFMKSDLRPTGSVYTKLWGVTLGGR
jgi:2'-5' RNA ligase